MLSKTASCFWSKAAWHQNICRITHIYIHIYAYLETRIHVHTYVITANPLGPLSTVVDKQLILSLQMAVRHGDSWIAKSQYPHAIKLTTIIVVYQIHKPVCRLPSTHIVTAPQREGLEYETDICCFWKQVFYSLRKHRLIGIGIPIVNFRRSSKRFIFGMGIFVPVSDVFWWIEVQSKMVYMDENCDRILHSIRISRDVSS